MLRDFSKILEKKIYFIELFCRIRTNFGRSSKVSLQIRKSKIILERKRGFYKSKTYFRNVGRDCKVPISKVPVHNDKKSKLFNYLTNFNNKNVQVNILIHS